ncbi:hypothetical protein QOM21_01880 [Streptomyces sp. Pv4-95]|uniref:hypothetical protein n=1 Tax=Streptomyces sp. Pv4-95 TaxID=3049543 RepID=UPI0038929A5E
MTTAVADQNDSQASSDPEGTGIETLGHANRFATWDSEFRYDGRIRVPMGVRIKAVKYSYQGTDKPDMIAATKVERGRGGIDTTFLADTDVITLTLRGDLNVDADPRPACSHTYTIRVEVTLDDGTVRNAYPKIEVLVPNWRREGDGRMVGRPFVRLPYDTGWGGKPNSQAGFGCVSDNGLIEDRFIVDLVNPRRANRASRATTATVSTTSWCTRTAPPPPTLPPRKSWRTWWATRAAGRSTRCCSAASICGRRATAPGTTASWSGRSRWTPTTR